MRKFERPQTEDRQTERRRYREIGRNKRNAIPPNTKKQKVL